MGTTLPTNNNNKQRERQNTFQPKLNHKNKNKNIVELQRVKTQSHVALEEEDPPSPPSQVVDVVDIEVLHQKNNSLRDIANKRLSIKAKQQKQKKPIKDDVALSFLAESEPKEIEDEFAHISSPSAHGLLFDEKYNEKQGMLSIEAEFEKLDKDKKMKHDAVQ